MIILTLTLSFVSCFSLGKTRSVMQSIFPFSFVSALAVVFVSVDGVGCDRGALLDSRHYLLCMLWS